MSSFTEVTSQSWGSRLMGSLKGVLFGIFLFFAAIVLLWWNEGRAVARAKALVEGKGIVISANSDQIITDNNGKLVHVGGLVEINGELRDDLTNINFGEVVGWNRSIEMFQWIEKVETTKKKKLGGSEETVKTYSYVKDWSSSEINSANFNPASEGKVNPTMPYRSGSGLITEAKLGKFLLNQSQIGRLGIHQKFLLSNSYIDSIPLSLKSKSRIESGGIYVKYDSLSTGGPNIGDVKITFNIKKPGEVSLVAEQVGNSFQPYITSNDGNIDLFTNNRKSAAQMFSSAESSNTTMTWILRGVGFFMMMIGIGLIFKPLVTLGDVVPFIGSILNFGTGIISFVLALVVSLLVIALAWIFYRPLLGIGLIVCAVGIFFLIKKMGDKKKVA